MLLAAGLPGCPTGVAPSFDIAGIAVLDDPRSELACTVRWVTDVPATSRVEYGPGELRYFVEDEELGTDHELHLIGLRADATHTLELVSENAAGTEVRSEPQSFTPDAVPFTVAVTDVTVRDPEVMQPGWTLFNMVVGFAIGRVTAVMVDDEGTVVWYHDLGEGGGLADVDVSFSEGKVLVGGAIPPDTRPVEVDLSREVVWEGPPQSELALAGSMHHAFKKLANGNYLAMVHDHRDGNDYLHDRIAEFDGEATEVWSWHADTVPDHGEDYLQGNNVHVDPDLDRLLYNARYTSTVYAVDRASGEVDWRLGEAGDFTMTTEHEHPWFGCQHATSTLGDGQLLMYDNGHAGRGYTRVVEYALDEVAMTASLTWEYDGSTDGGPWISDALGDADRLDNGNTLICAGSLRENDTPSRIIEVDADGQRVWEMGLRGPDEDQLAACYSVQRIPLPVGLL